jgi:hypothetical protein
MQEARVGDTDDGDLGIVEADDLAQGGGGGAKDALPIGIVQNDGGRRSGRAVDEAEGRPRMVLRPKVEKKSPETYHHVRWWPGRCR